MRCRWRRADGQGLRGEREAHSVNHVVSETSHCYPDHMRRARTFVIGLLMLWLPLQAIAAVSMPFCPHGGMPGVAETAVHEHHHHKDSAPGSGHHGNQHGDQHPAAGAPAAVQQLRRVQSGVRAGGAGVRAAACRGGHNSPTPLRGPFPRAVHSRPAAAPSQLPLLKLSGVQPSAARRVIASAPAPLERCNHPLKRRGSYASFSAVARGPRPADADGRCMRERTAESAGGGSSSQHPCTGRTRPDGAVGTDRLPRLRRHPIDPARC